MDEGWVGLRLDCRGARGTGKVAAVAGEWLVVRAGRLGRLTAVPAADAVQGAGCVWVPYERDLIRSAPRLESAGELDAERERALREHYEVRP
jgi:hypothetical protein